MKPQEGHKQNRLRNLALGLGALVVLLALVTTAAGARAAAVQGTETLDPLFASATAIVRAATSTSEAIAGATATTNSLLKTDPIQVTASAVVRAVTTTAEALTEANAQQSFYATATGLAADATSTREALLTLSPQPTEDYAATATSAPQTVQALYAEATNIILQQTPGITVTPAPRFLAQTATASAYPTTTDPLFASATAIVRGATATTEALLTGTANPASAPPSTLAPTMSIQEAENLRLKFQSDLEKATGFSHPIFAHIAYGWLRNWDFLHDAPQRFGLVFYEVERVTYDGDTYVALIVRGSGRWYEDRDELLIFRQIDKNATLIFDSFLSREFAGFLWLNRDVPDGKGGFADRNGNGFPDLPIEGNPDGNCNSPTLVLLEIRPGDQVVDITPKSPSGVFLEGFVDLNHDGIQEIVGTDWVFDAPLERFRFGCNPLVVTHWFGWNGSAYVDISGTLDESYYPDIAAYWNSIEGQKGCLVPAEAMYQMLFEYRARGKLHEGWARLAPRLRWDKCSASELQAHSKEFEQLLDWINQNLNGANQNP